MEKFNFKRFWNISKSESLDLILAFAIIVFVFLMYWGSCLSFVFFQILLRLDGNDTQFGIIEAQENSFPLVVQLYLNCAYVFMFLLLVVTSMMFRSAARKSTLIPELMLPATPAEKFMAKMLVYWALPAAAAYAMMWFAPQITHHFQLIDANGVPVQMVKVNGLITVEASSLPSRWEQNGWLYCIYLCMSGILILAGSIFRNKNVTKTLYVFGTLIVVTLLTVLVFYNGQNFGLSEYTGFPLNFIRWIRESIVGVSLFQMLFSWIVVAVCAYFAYRRYARFTVK